MTLEQRLERLERENRWMKRIGMLAAAVAAAVFLVGQGKNKELPNLVVRSVQVKDEHGAVRAFLDEKGLVIHDEEGRAPRALLHGDSLNLYDANGRGRLSATVGETAGLYLSDGSRVRASLQMAAGGGPALHLMDKDGQRRVILAADAKASSGRLTLYDFKGTVIWQAPR